MCPGRCLRSGTLVRSDGGAFRRQGPLVAETAADEIWVYVVEILHMLADQSPDPGQVPAADRRDQGTVMVDLHQAVPDILVLGDVDQMDLLVDLVLLSDQVGVPRDLRDRHMELDVQPDAAVNIAPGGSLLAGVGKAVQPRKQKSEALP